MHKMDRRLSVVVCGGGNGAHAFAGIASNSHTARVTVLDVYENEAERWNESVSKHGFLVKFNDGRELFQPPGNVEFKVTNAVDSCVPDADVVVICVPAYAHQIYLDLVLPHLKPCCIVVGMPGQAGFEYQCVSLLRCMNKCNTVVSFESLPRACRISKYGKEVCIVGEKQDIVCSVVHQNKETGSEGSRNVLQKLQTLFGSKPRLQSCSSVLECTLLGKSTIHPPIMYAKWGSWDEKPLEKAPLFYQGVDDKAVEYVNYVNNELVKISETLATKYPKLGIQKLCSMQDWLIDHYGDQVVDKSSLLSCLQTNMAYDGLTHPCTENRDGHYVPDFGYRYTTEDVPYGLLVFREIGRLVGVETPVIDEIITWAQSKIDAEFLVHGNLSSKNKSKARMLCSYGINSADDLLNFFDK